MIAPDIDLGAPKFKMGVPNIELIASKLNLGAPKLTHTQHFLNLSPRIMAVILTKAEMTALAKASPDETYLVSHVSVSNPPWGNLLILTELSNLAMVSFSQEQDSTSGIWIPAFTGMTIAAKVSPDEIRLVSHTSISNLGASKPNLGV